jgi:hypothetical protein
MDAITLTLDSKTLDYIANVLGQRPYSEVAAVLQSIAVQVQAQRGPVFQQGNGAAGDSLPQ